MQHEKAVVQDVVLPGGRRLIMVSDIHGNLPFLKGLLHKVGFSPDDTLFLLGDVLEKGPASLDTLHYLMELRETHDVRPLCGNCDHLVLDFLRDDGGDEWFFLPYLKTWPRSILAQMGALHGLKTLETKEQLQALRQVIGQHFQREAAYLATWPTVIRSEKLLLVHGGVDDEDHPENMERWRCMKNDDFLGQGVRFRRTCVVGHWPVTLYDPEKPSARPLLAREQRIWSIDGGCVLKLDGQLNALIFAGEEDEAPTWDAFDGLPTAIALDDQAESARSVNIRWGKSEVEVLQKGEERSLCRHVLTGRELLILNEYLYTGRDGKLHCQDSTDYRLPVAAGDKVKVVRRVKGDALIKKEGVTGWYGGRLKE